MYASASFPKRLVTSAKQLSDPTKTAGRLTFYNCILWGVQLLVSVHRLDQAAIFDGIASTGLAAEYRAGAWAHLHALVATARTARGPEQYDQAFQTGAAMNYDQAIEHTLQVLDDVILENARGRHLIRSSASAP